MRSIAGLFLVPSRFLSIFPPRTRSTRSSLLQQSAAIKGHVIGYLKLGRLDYYSYKEDSRQYSNLEMSPARSVGLDILKNKFWQEVTVAHHVFRASLAHPCQTRKLSHFSINHSWHALTVATVTSYLDLIRELFNHGTVLQKRVTIN